MSSAVGLCEGVHPAYPLDPPSGRTFNTNEGVPEQFIGTRKFFYLTRFMFAFVLIGLFFAVSSLATGLLALCTRIAAYISGFLNMVGLFFQLLAAILMTYDIILLCLESWALTWLLQSRICSRPRRISLHW
jgi:SUR7/PalI family